MKKYLISLLIFTASCSPKVVEKSIWQSLPVTVDARTSEYKDMRFYNSKTRMFYSVYNDSINLYVCLTIKDEKIQQQIVMAGMEVWIDTTKRNRQLTGIKYPIKTSQRPEMSPEPNGFPAQKPDISMIRQNFMLTPMVGEIKGFNNIPEGLSPLVTMEGLKVKMEWDGNESLIYELQVPLEIWYKKINFVDSTDIFCLTVNINALEMPGMKGDPPGDGPGGVGFGGNPPEGMGNNFSGGRPSMDSEGMGGIMGMSEAHSFKMNFKLNLDAK